MSDPFDPGQFQPASGRTLHQVCSSGTEVPPLLVVEPDVLYFHFVGVGETSDWQPFLLTNNGAEQLAIVDIDLTGEFELQGDLPGIILPGETLTVSIRFKPQSTGTKIGSFTIDADQEVNPKIFLIGIGGELSAQFIMTEADVKPTVDAYIRDKWGYRYGSFAVADIEANEILLDYHVSTAHTLQPNFAGCRFSVGSTPAAPFILTVFRGLVQIGTITINADGSIVGATPFGLAQAIPANSIITVKAPAEVDESIGRLRMTFVGIV